LRRHALYLPERRGLRGRLRRQGLRAQLSRSRHPVLARLRRLRIHHGVQAQVQQWSADPVPERRLDLQQAVPAGLAPIGAAARAPARGRSRDRRRGSV
jgi:hypothetical protein